MTNDTLRIANFIIGGTEKAGTTSVFSYLAEHPEVCSASRKETDFFRRESTGNEAEDRRAYARCFPQCAASVPIVMEASPGYLGEAASVVPRMSALVSDARLLFILRDPVERLYSSYNFHLSKLQIPEDVDFAQYVEKCLAYDRGTSNVKALGLEQWYLKTLSFGRYAEYLLPYFMAFPAEHIKVMFFEDLRVDAAAFMRSLSEFLGIDARFWNEYEFHKTNVTFYSRAKGLHRVAMIINAKAEPFLRRRPQLKRVLVGCYKQLNQAREGYEPMPQALRRELESYYRPSKQALRELLGRPLPRAWDSVAEAAN